MEKLAFNHELESSMEACSINEQVINEKYTKFVEETNRNQGKSVSFMVEIMEKSFTPREIAFIAAQKILGEAEMQARMMMGGDGSSLARLMEAVANAKRQVK